MTEARKPVSNIRQPGALRSETELEIQTRQAQRLVYGRRKEGDKTAIIGLLRFGTMLRPIWDAAAADCPWADWKLIQVEQILTEARESMDALQAQVNKTLDSKPAIDVSVAHSVKPVKVPLVFTSPYAFQGAYLLADFDILARSVLTARHIGLYNREKAEELTRTGGRLVRGTYLAAAGYKYLGVCREDLRQNTAKAQRAIDMLGQLPQEVIDGTMRADHAPDIKQPGESRTPSVADGFDDDDADNSDSAAEDEAHLSVVKEA